MTARELAKALAAMTAFRWGLVAGALVASLIWALYVEIKRDDTKFAIQVIASGEAVSRQGGAEVTVRDVIQTCRDGCDDLWVNDQADENHTIEVADGLGRRIVGQTTYEVTAGPYMSRYVIGGIGPLAITPVQLERRAPGIFLRTRRQ